MGDVGIGIEIRTIGHTEYINGGLLMVGYRVWGSRYFACLE
jgi:hypothetical protein